MKLINFPLFKQFYGVLHKRRVAHQYFNQIRFNSYSLNIKIEDISLNNYINKLQNEYEKLHDNPSNDRIRYIKSIIDILKERNKVIDSISNLKELLDDKDADIRHLAKEEKSSYEAQIKALDETLANALLPEDNDIHCNGMVLEVKAGVGGQEAMLFASEMFNMYTNFANYKSWDSEIAEYDVSDMGGIRHASLLINSNNAFNYFKHEAGVHRVQRIPTTEKSGRIHTSTVSVNAIPQPDDIEINIPMKDLKIETKRASGAGGQHVNTTDSAVRITHLPSGTAVECQTDRSQIKNRQIAMQRLKAKLYEAQLESQYTEQENMKKMQVRSNFRNEKIRTYNFTQDRISDHRLTSHSVHNLKVFMLGGAPLENLITKIDYQNRINKLRMLVNV